MKSLIVPLCILVSAFAFGQETFSSSLMWTYDIPDTKDTQFQRVQIHLKYELFTEKIGDNKYKVWARYTFSPQFTHIQPERGGIYYYKYHGKWYNSDDMWRIDPRTNDGFANTYGFVPDVKVTQVSMSGKIIGDKEALFFAPTSDNYHVTSADLGYISDPKQLRNISISPNNTWVNYISTSGTSVLQKRIGEYEKKLASNKSYDDVIKKADAAFNSKKYLEAQNLYQEALNHRKNDSYAKKQLEESKRLAEQEKKKTEQAQQQNQSSSSSTQTNSSNDFWNDKPTSQTPQKSKEQIAKEKQYQETKDRYEKSQNSFFENQEKQRQLTAKNDAYRATNYYLAEARSRAEQGISGNSSFNRRFDNVEELNSAFQQQVWQINQSANELSEVKNQQLNNNINHNLQNTNETTQAVGQAIGLIGNIVNNAQAERDRKAAIEKLEKERKEQIARMENERKQKILNLRADIFRQFPEGGVPLSRHKVELDELYFFTYSYNQNNTSAKVSNVFPYAKYKDGTWAFKDKVTAESEKATGGKVTLVGYYTTKQLAEKERNAFVQLLPQAEVNVSTFEVKGKKQDTTSNTSTDFWGSETKTETKTTTQEKKDSFWDDTPATKTDKKTETKKSDSFWD